MPQLKELGVEVGPEDVAFAKFIIKGVFPGGQLCDPDRIQRLVVEDGFAVEHVEPLRLHYARALDIWAKNLSNANSEAIELTSSEVFERYMKYLAGCAVSFRRGFIDVIQFRLRCDYIGHKVATKALPSDRGVIDFTAEKLHIELARS